MNYKKYSKVWMVLFVWVLILTGCSSNKTKDPLQVSTVLEQMKAAFLWQEANPIFAKAPTDWTNGAYYTGVVKAAEATGQKEYVDGLLKMGRSNKWMPYERYYHADDLAICYSYLYLAQEKYDDVDLGPTDTIMWQHTFKPHAWRDKIEGKDQQCLWWWCDALFMTPPVYTKYAVLNNDVKWLNHMDTFYHETYNLLFDKEEHLFARDLRFVWKDSADDVKETNGNKVFWSRGNGWVIGGLALVLNEMPKDYEGRDFYLSLYKEMAARILEIQPEDGLWRTSLLAPENFEHGEVSGSGFYTFALAWGINNGILDQEIYQPAVLKAWKALSKCQHPNGMVGWVQNIGFDPKPADFDSWQNYGTGAFLLAGSEMISLLKNIQNP